HIYLPTTSIIFHPSLHDALPISSAVTSSLGPSTSAEQMAPSATREPVSTPRETSLHATRSTVPTEWNRISSPRARLLPSSRSPRSEEHTSELQSRENIVCRLLLE